MKQDHTSKNNECVSYIGKHNQDSYKKQKDAIEEYAEKNGLKIVSSIINKTVSKENVILLNNILFNEDIKKYRCLIIAKREIISSDFNDFLYLLFLIKKRSIELIIVNDSKTSRRIDEYQEVITYFSQREINTKVIETKAGKEKLAKTGNYYGGRCPLGYNVKNGKLVINSKEAEVVRAIFYLFDKKVSVYQIAKKINIAGGVGKTNKKLSYGSVWHVLQRRKFYEGYVDYENSGNWKKGKHRAILKNTEREV